MRGVSYILIIIERTDIAAQWIINGIIIGRTAKLYADRSYGRGSALTPCNRFIYAKRKLFDAVCRHTITRVFHLLNKTPVERPRVSKECYSRSSSIFYPEEELW